MLHYLVRYRDTILMNLFVVRPDPELINVTELMFYKPRKSRKQAFYDSTNKRVRR